MDRDNIAWSCKLIAIEISDNRLFSIANGQRYFGDGASYRRFPTTTRLNRGTNWNLPASAERQECRRDPVAIQEWWRSWRRRAKQKGGGPIASTRLHRRISCPLFLHLSYYQNQNLFSCYRLRPVYTSEYQQVVSGKKLLL